MWGDVLRCFSNTCKITILMYTGKSYKLMCHFNIPYKYTFLLQNYHFFVIPWHFTFTYVTVKCHISNQECHIMTQKCDNIQIHHKLMCLLFQFYFVTIWFTFRICIKMQLSFRGVDLAWNLFSFELLGGRHVTSSPPGVNSPF